MDNSIKSAQKKIEELEEKLNELGAFVAEMSKAVDYLLKESKKAEPKKTTKTKTLKEQ